MKSWQGYIEKSEKITKYHVHKTKNTTSKKISPHYAIWVQFGQAKKQWLGNFYLLPYCFANFVHSV